MTGQTVLVHGVLGGVGSLAAQLAVWGGASVIATVRRSADLASVDLPTFALDAHDPAADFRGLSPGGVDRVVEVAFSANLELDRAVAAVGATIAAYGTRDGNPAIPFWPMLFDNLTIRLLGSDDFPTEAKQEAARDLTLAASSGALSPTIAAALPLERIAEAHELVDSGMRGRVLLDVDV